MIDRRIVGLGLCALILLPATGRTQPKGKIGYLHQVTADPSHITFSILKQAWDRLGYQEGQTVLARGGQGNVQQLPGLIAELVAQGVGVLIVVGADAVQAASRTTKSVPIVAVDMETDPVETGLVSSYARPGGNLTGLFVDLPSLATKWVELMREAAPIERIAFLWQPSTGRGQLDAAFRAAQDMNLEAIVLEVGPLEDDLSAKFSRLTGSKGTGVVQLTMPGASIRAAKYAVSAAKYGLPTITFSGASAKAGMLMSYGPSQQAYFPRAVEIADKILGGDKVGEVPIERPSKFELIINLKTARALGLDIKSLLLARADEVID